MFKLDNDFLTSLGLGGLPVEEKNKLLQHIYETLEMRVGMRLAEKMTDQQLDEFESFIERNDEPGALKWLETNFPNYKDVVAEELEKLKVEVTTAAPQILAAANANMQAAQGQPQPQMQQPMQPQQPDFAQPASQPQPMQQPVPSYQPQAPAPAPMPEPQPAPQMQPQPMQQPSPGFAPPQQPAAQPQQFTPPPPGFTPGQ